MRCFNEGMVGVVEVSVESRPQLRGHSHSPNFEASIRSAYISTGFHSPCGCPPWDAGRCSISHYGVVTVLRKRQTTLLESCWPFFELCVF